MHWFTEYNCNSGLKCASVPLIKQCAWSFFCFETINKDEDYSHVVCGLKLLLRFEIEQEFLDKNGFPWMKSLYPLSTSLFCCLTQFCCVAEIAVGRAWNGARELGEAVISVSVVPQGAGAV